MNQFIRMGRLVADPEVRYSSGENATCIANFRIAVDKKFKRRDSQDAPTADFFRITAFGKLGEFTEKYLKKGTKVLVTGRTENNNYKNADGNTVYRDQDIAESIEFAESKKAQAENGSVNTAPVSDDFMNIPDSTLSDDGLPFK